MEVESASKSRRSSVNKDVAANSGKKSNKSKSPTPVAAEVVEQPKKLATPQKKTPIAAEVVEEPKKRTTTPQKRTPAAAEVVEEPKKKATPQKKTPVAPVVEEFFLLDNLKINEGTSAQNESKDALSTVLTEALQNNDAQLFDVCFENEDIDVIDTTVKKLAQNKILTLLEKLGERIDNGKRTNYNFSAWLSAIVRNHSTFLIKLPEMANKIAPLIGALQKRTLAIDQVHRLKGKIDMVLDIETEVTRPKKAPKKVASEQKSLITYEENEGQKQGKKARGKKQGYTKAMEELEDIEGEEEDFGGEDFEGEEDSEGDGEGEGEGYDAYLDEGQDYEDGGEDDDDDGEDFDEEEDDEDEEGFDME